jgi:light-regulated signal transduction histidine kinase (bacteriophytochrome)
MSRRRTAHPGRVEFQAKDWYRRSVTRLREAEAVLSIGHDQLRREIARRQDAEARLRRSNNHLSARVRELGDIRKELEERNSDLGKINGDLQQFVFVASHDLKEPMRSISSFSDLLATRYRGVLDDEATEWIAFLQRGVQRMFDLIAGLLSYSSVSGATNQFRSVSLDDALDDALANLTANLGEHSISIERTPLPVVAADRSLMAVLFQNLVGNAVKFRRDSEPRIWIGAEERADEWVIFVRDNGIGIAEKHHAKVFEVFKRLHLQSDYPGTGIGLAVCRRIVEHHGGRIWLAAQLDEGCTFSFAIPKNGDAAE